VILDPCFSSQNSVDLEMSAFHLMRDVDGYLFINYLSAMTRRKYAPPRLELCLDEDRLKIHKEQVERLLEEKQHDPNVWSKYFWTANYHDAFCDQVQRKQYKINESLLRVQPVGLLKSVVINTW